MVDPANEELIGRHLPSLFEETEANFSPADEDILGTPFYSAAAGMNATVPRNFSPQPQLNLRGGIGQSFALRRNAEELGRISTIRRFREAYIGAVFPFFGQRYHVRSHEEQAVILEDTEQHLKTEAGFFSVLSRSEIFDGISYGDISAYHGSLNIVMNFTGYKLVDERNGRDRQNGRRQ